MRKLFGVFALGALLFAGTAQADTFVTGTLAIRLSGLPPITLGSGAGAVTGGVGGATVTEASLLFGPTSIDLPDSLFTGVPQISDLRIAGLGKPAGGSATFSLGGLGTTVNAAGTSMFADFYGGQAPVAGTATICVYACAAIQVAIPLTIVGAGGTLYATALFQPLTVTAGGGWTAGAASIAGINSEVNSNAAMTFTCAPVTCPVTVLVTGAGNGSFVTKVTVTGATSTSMTIGGATLPASLRALILVTPVRTNSLAGALPLFGIQQLIFAVVPEPGTLLLLGSGVLGLAAIGRRRMKR